MKSFELIRHRHGEVAKVDCKADPLYAVIHFGIEAMYLEAQAFDLGEWCYLSPGMIVCAYEGYEKNSYCQRQRIFRIAIAWEGQPCPLEREKGLTDSFAPEAPKVMRVWIEEPKP